MIGALGGRLNTIKSIREIDSEIEKGRGHTSLNSPNTNLHRMQIKPHKPRERLQINDLSTLIPLVGNGY